MNIIPLDFSIVVVGQDCNPTILNPDFLKYRGIVPEEWGWGLPDMAITTPAFAVVAYSSGITIKVEPNRFQVTDQKAATNVAQSKAIDIARSYINVLPHVRYTGVGINFRRLIEMEEPDAFIRKRFLNNGRWNQAQRPLLGVNLKFMYEHENGRLSLSLEGSALVSQQEGEAGPITGVLAHANYHRDCGAYPADEVILAHLDRAVYDEKHLDGFAKEVLFTESELNGQEEPR